MHSLNAYVWILKFQTLNESFWLKTVFKTASKDDDVIIIAIFMINQMKLRKKLMITTCVKDCLNNICKSELFDVQKLQLKEVITVNDIACDALDVFYYFVYSTAF